MNGENADGGFPAIAEGKEGSIKKPLVVYGPDTYRDGVDKSLPHTAWKTSVKEHAACYFVYDEVHFGVRPDGQIGYASIDEATKDPGKFSLDAVKDYLIGSLVQDLLADKEAKS